MQRKEKIIEKHEKYVVKGWPLFYAPIIFTEGEGCIVKDITGKEYIDCVSGCAGPMWVGWKNPKVVEATKKYAEFPHSFPGFVNIPRVELAEKIAKIAPPNLTKTWFGCSGGEVIELAIKSAILYTGKKEVISLYNGYHGFTIAVSALIPAIYRKDMPIMPGFRQIPSPYCYRCAFGKEYPECDYECARNLESVIKHGTYNDVAAFILEPIQGQAGHILPPDKEYAKIIREICDKYDILIIADEIQTGLGRTGKMWGSDYIGLRPDIICLGKTLCGGLPLSAAVFREDIAEKTESKLWGVTTHSGAPILCATACAVFDVLMEEKVLGKANRMGKVITQRLKSMQERHEIIGEIRGPGLFIGVEMVRDRKTKEEAFDEVSKIIQMCLEKGVWFGRSMANMGNLIKIKPPFIITENQITKALNTLDEVLTKLKNKK